MPSYPKSWLLSVVRALALRKRTVGWCIPAVTVRSTVLSPVLSLGKVRRGRSLRLRYALGMKMKPFGRTLLKTSHVLCVWAASFLWLSVNRDAGIRVGKGLRSALGRGGSMDLLQNLWWCCGYLNSRKVLQPLACQSLQEIPRHSFPAPLSAQYGNGLWPRAEKRACSPCSVLRDELLLVLCFQI